MTAHERTAPEAARDYRYESSPAPAYPFAPRAGGGPAPAGARAVQTPAAPTTATEAKNPVLHLVASFFVPGLGSFLNGDSHRGIVIFAAYLASWFGYLLLVWALVGFIFLPVAVAVWGFGMVDAYRGAEDWNRRHGVRP